MGSHQRTFIMSMDYRAKITLVMEDEVHTSKILPKIVGRWRQIYQGKQTTVHAWDSCSNIEIQSQYKDNIVRAYEDLLERLKPHGLEFIFCDIHQLITTRTWEKEEDE